MEVYSMRYIAIILVIIGTLISCQQASDKEEASINQISKAKPLHDDKNVIVLVIDSITEALLEDGLKKGTIPALSYLIKNGTVYHDVISTFPSMSVVME